MYGTDQDQTNLNITEGRWWHIIYEETFDSDQTISLGARLSVRICNGAAIEAVGKMECDAKGDNEGTSVSL